MTDGVIYAWAVLTPGPSKVGHWRVFKSRKLARAYRDQHGGSLYKIERSH